MSGQPGPSSRILRGLFAAFPICLLLAAAAAGQPPPAAAEAGSRCDRVLPGDLKRVCESGVLRVARYKGERPPFFFERDGQWVGFGVDLGRDIAERLGVRYREDASAESFDAVVDMVAAGEADIGLSKLSSTLERGLRVRFTDPYLTVYQALLVNRLSVPQRGDPFQSLNATGLIVGALDGSSYVGYAESLFGAAEVRPFADFGVMMDEVVDGGIDAALMDSARANTWRRANSERLIQVRTTVDKKRKDPLAIAVGWRDTQLLAWLNLYLRQIKADGTGDALYRRWFTQSGSPGARKDG